MASHELDRWSEPQRDHINDFFNFPARRWARKGIIKCKSANWLGVPRGKAPNGIPLPLQGRRMVGPRSPPVTMAQSD